MTDLKRTDVNKNVSVQLCSYVEMNQLKIKRIYVITKYH